jgi:hypothetical protein
MKHDRAVIGRWLARAASALLTRVWRIEPHRFWEHKAQLVRIVSDGAERVRPHAFPPLNRKFRSLTFFQQSVCLIAEK